VSGEASIAVVVWWASISIIGVVNIALWIRAVRRRAGDRRQLWLSGVYVFVCAFRSFVPRADVQRICLFDSVVASVFVGRSVATVAELCFIFQLSLAGRSISRALGVRAAYVLSTLPLFMIPVAETCSWYSVITTNYIGNTIEESLWAASAVLFGVSLALLVPRASGMLKRVLTVSLVLAFSYVAFMLSVDVRMYLTRFLADHRAGRPYLSIADGIHDVIYRRIVTFAWSDWHEEMAWMFLYFSIAVWLSLSLISAARLWQARTQQEMAAVE
jgi:hypothetical protein